MNNSKHYPTFWMYNENKKGVYYCNVPDGRKMLIFRREALFLRSLSSFYLNQTIHLPFIVSVRSKCPNYNALSALGNDIVT